ncbi:MAG: hypothetical protein M3014_08705 [Chloroflexota bacterium]|nr:hypothetical protein [Chloroflexota bacterium]
MDSNKDPEQISRGAGADATYGGGAAANLPFQSEGTGSQSQGGDYSQGDGQQYNQGAQEGQQRGQGQAGHHTTHHGGNEAGRAGAQRGAQGVPQAGQPSSGGTSYRGEQPGQGAPYDQQSGGQVFDGTQGGTGYGQAPQGEQYGQEQGGQYNAGTPQQGGEYGESQAGQYNQQQGGQYNQQQGGQHSAGTPQQSGSYGQSQGGQHNQQQGGQYSAGTPQPGNEYGGGNPGQQGGQYSAGNMQQGGGMPQAAGASGASGGMLGGLLPQIGQWMNHYQTGNSNQVPHDEVHKAYGQWAQQTDPGQVQQATTQGYQQVPQAEHAGIGSALLGLFGQHGLSPQAAGVQTTDPSRMTPSDLGKLTSYAQQQQPDAIGQLFKPGGALSNPMVGMALAGALAYGASRMAGGH